MTRTEISLKTIDYVYSRHHALQERQVQGQGKMLPLVGVSGNIGTPDGWADKCFPTGLRNKMPRFYVSGFKTINITVMGMFWQIKIDTRTADGETIDTQWLDRFEHSVDATTFIREYCKLYPEWKLSGEYKEYAIKYNADGSSCHMYAYGHILFTDWMDYITSNYRECKAKFDTTDICYNGSNI